MLTARHGQTTCCCSTRVCQPTMLVRTAAIAGRRLNRSVRVSSNHNKWLPPYLPSGADISSYASVDSVDGAERGSQLPASSDSESGANSQEVKAALIRKALTEGNLGLSFSAGGFLYTYHLGVLWELARLGVLPPPGDPKALKMAGSSAGSLAIATYACGLDVSKATQALFEFAADCRSHGTRGRLGNLVRDFLHEYLPDDAHERCRDLTYVYITRVFPVWQPEVIHRFHDKSDLVEALATSCHIPVYANGQWMTKFRGRYYMDGGVAAFIPEVPLLPASVKVCCFPVNEMLSRVQPNLEGYPRVSSLLDVAISPDKFESWPHSYAQLVQWALVPADDEMLKYLMAKGRRDAQAWARSLKLVPEEDEQGMAHVEQPHGPAQVTPKTDVEQAQATPGAHGGMVMAEPGRKAL